MYSAQSGILGQAPKSDVDEAKVTPQSSLPYEHSHNLRNDIQRDWNKPSTVEFGSRSTSHDMNRQNFDVKDASRVESVERKPYEHLTIASGRFESSTLVRTSYTKKEENVGYADHSTAPGSRGFYDGGYSRDDFRNEKPPTSYFDAVEQMRPSDQSSRYERPRTLYDAGEVDMKSNYEVKKSDYDRPGFERNQPTYEDKYRFGQTQNRGYTDQSRQPTYDQKASGKYDQVSQVLRQSHADNPNLKTPYEVSNSHSRNYSSQPRAVEQWQSRSMTQSSYNTKPAENDQSYGQARSNRQFPSLEGVRKQDAPETYREPERLYQQYDSARRGVQSSEGHTAAQQYGASYASAGSNQSYEEK